MVQEGESAFLKMLFQGENTLIPAGTGNFYVGLCNQVPAPGDTLTQITTEPTVANGYARIALVRDATDWPTVELVNGVYRIVSKLITWTASGGDFDKAFTRAFLCSAASGTSGTLFGYSGPLNSAVTLLNGQSKSAQYEFFLN